MELAPLSDDREGTGMRPRVKVRSAHRREISKIVRPCVMCSKRSYRSEVHWRMNR